MDPLQNMGWVHGPPIFTTPFQTKTSSMLDWWLKFLCKFSHTFDASFLAWRYVIKQMAQSFITELHGLHLQIPSLKTTWILSLKHRRKVGLPSLIQATGIELLMHEDCRLLACSFVITVRSNVFIAWHRFAYLIRFVKAFPVPLSLTTQLEHTTRLEQYTKL